MIESLKNQRIKDTVKLREGKHRRKLSRFLIEGEREFQRAVQSDFSILEVFFSQDILSETSQTVLDQFEGIKTEVSAEVFAKLVLREDSGGLCAVAEFKRHSLNQLKTSDKSPFILATEGVEKPGNLGAILRSADSAGVDAIVILDQIVDEYNPNCIRASLGAIFSVPIIHCTSAQFKDYCQSKGILVAAASPFAQKNYYAADFKQGTAIVLGSEANGLSKIWDDCLLVKIPMAGICDSLNVSVAAAIIMYEIVRQRS